MRLKSLALGLCLLSASLSMGSHKATVNRTKTSTKPGFYIVKQGDDDWTLAHKWGLTARELQAANPDIDWRKMRPGLQLRIPSKAKATGIVASAPAKSKATKSSHKSAYVVRGDDNDWTIASKLGITPKALRAANPDVNWRKLRPGTKITAPVAQETVAVATKVPKIKSRYAKVKADDVNVRSEPGRNAERVERVSAGERGKIISRDGSWYHVKFEDGTKGWVRGDFLVAANTHSSNDNPRLYHRKHRNDPEPSYPSVSGSGSGSSVVKSALNMRGTRYSYGSAGRHATDCSGLALQSYKKVGVTLPRTSAEQSHVGKAVSKSELRPGDLVFFKTNAGRRINHVGIYVGDGKFVHASSGAGKVRVSSLNEGYYNNRYATARRVLKPSKSSKKSSSHKKHSVD